MFEHIADFTAWPILTGVFIGYIANRIMSGEGKGCCMNLFIGIVGRIAIHYQPIRAYVRPTSRNQSISGHRCYPIIHQVLIPLCKLMQLHY